MTQPVLSICIVSLRARDLLKDCLDSVALNPPSFPYEIIVVDNASGDGTIEMLRENYPAVRWHENPENLGYTLPMNQALKMGTGAYLMQLNPDTLIKPGAFDCLVQFMQAHPAVGIGTPKVLNRDGTLQKQCRRSAARPWDTLTYFTGLSRRFPKSRRFGGYLMTYLDENEVNEVEAVSGSCMLIRRGVIDQIGYLDELFVSYQEDSDFCFRVRAAGWKIFYVPQAEIIHYGGQGGSRVAVYNSIYQWHRSYYLYYRKHLARDYFFLVNWFFYAAMLGKLILNLVVTLVRKDKFAGTRKP